MNELLNKIELLCWDNEGDADEAGAGDTGAGDAGAAAAAASAEEKAKAAAAATDAAANPPPKTFTQDQVNKFVSERNKALKVQFEQMEENYETLLKQQNLTNEQRDKLEADRDRLRVEMMTKEQRLEAEKKKAEEKFQTELSAAQGEANKYKELFESSTISREITDAAVKHDAFNPQHFIAHLAPKSKMVEEMDSEGKPTGNLVPRVEWTTMDKDTGATQVTLKTPEEAVELMKENVVDFGCLFKANVAAGIGQGTAPGQASSAGAIDHKRISTEEYMKLAKTPEGRRQLGIN